MFFNYLTKRNLFFALLLMLSYFFVIKLPSSKANFITLTLVVSLFMLLFGIYNILFKFLAEDIQNKKYSKTALKQSAILLLLWITSVFLANKVGGVSWIFSTLDEATVLFFIFIPVVFIFGISARANAMLAIIIWIYTAFYYLNNFTKSSELFAILTFWFFAMATVKGIIEA